MNIRIRLMDHHRIFIFIFWLCMHQGGLILSHNSHDGHPDSSFKSHALIDLSVVHGKTMKNSLFISEQVDAITVTFQYQNRSYILDLNQNRAVIAEGAVLRYKRNGTYVTERTKPSEDDRCLYTGTIRGSEGSTVALSTCGGVNGVVSEPGHTLFLSPGPGGRHWLYLQRDLVQYRDNRPATQTHTSPAGPATQQPTGRRRWRREAAALRGPVRASPSSLYLELVLVLDFHVYRENGEDLVTTHRRAKQIANIVHSVYARLDIFVALVGVDVWTEGDEITLSANADDTLTNFLHYRRERLSSEMPNDNAQLLTGTKFDGGIVGKALRRVMCTYDNSGGVNMDHSEQVSLVAATVAHEMGHNLGLEHDSAGCQCADERCVMSASSSSVGPTRWSSCSRSQLALSLQHGLGHCLHNKPTAPLFAAPVCGNGFVEEGEECDCGLLSDCTTPCCDAITCRLKYNGTCAAGGCCDLQTCRPRSAGETCRPVRGECDLAEYCNGTSQLCPADVWRLDGLPCSGGQSHCYGGQCATRDDQCRLLWGQSGSDSAPQCYEQNVQGNHRGDCGYSRPNDSYRACQHSDILCGRLHCAHLNEKLEYGVESSAKLFASFMNISGKVLPCRSAVIDLGLRQRDPGLVPQGAPCGSGQMCVDQRCVLVSSVTAGGCPGGCSGRGVCNSLGHCHCDYGWAPPDCAEAGVGGSVDSGPNLQNNAAQTLAVVLFVIFLGLVPAAALVFCCVYCRRHGLKPSQFLQRPACCRLPACRLPACRLPSFATLRRKLPTAGSATSRPAAGAARSVRRPDVPREPPGKAASYNVRLLVLSGEDELLQPAPSRPTAPPASSQPPGRGLAASLLGRLGSLSRPATTDGTGRPSDRLVCEVKPTAQPTAKPATSPTSKPAAKQAGAAAAAGGAAGKSGVGGAAGVKKVIADRLRPTQGVRTTFGMLGRQADGVSADAEAGNSAADATRRTTFGMTSLAKKASGKPGEKPAGDKSGVGCAGNGGGSGAGDKPVSSVASARSAFLSGETGKPAVPAGPPPARVVTGQVRFAANTLEKKPSGSTPEKKPTGSTLDRKASSVVGKTPTSALEKKPPGAVENKPTSTLEKKPTSTLDKKPTSTLDKRPTSTLDKKPTSTLDKKPTSTLDKKPTSTLDKKPTVRSLPDTKLTWGAQEKPTAAAERIPLVSRSDSVPSAPVGGAARELRSTPGQVRFAPDTLERRPTVARSDSAPAGSYPGQELPRSGPGSRSSTLESDRSDTLRSSGSERDGSLGSTLSRVASVFRRGEKAADPPAAEPGLRPSQSFKAAKLDRDTVRTLGISNPIPLPAGQFSTLPTSPRGRREGRVPARASSDVGRPLRPVSLLVRPTEPPPRPPNVTELYDDCNADWHAAGGSTPTENIYCTIDEAPEERPRPKSMVEPGVLSDAGALYQNTIERRVPWRSVGTRQPTVARTDSAPAARAVKACSPIAEERTASVTSLADPIARPSASSVKQPLSATQTAKTTSASGRLAKQPVASAWSANKFTPTNATSARESTSSASSTKPSTTSSPSLKQTEARSQVTQPAAAADSVKQSAAATAPTSKKPADSAAPSKQTTASALSSKQPTTSAASAKRTAVSSPPERQSSVSSISSKESRPTTPSAKQSATSSVSSKTSTSSPASTRSFKQTTPSTKSSTSSTPASKKPTSSALASKQPASSAQSSKKSTTPVSSRPGTLSSASSQQSVSSATSSRSTISSPSSEKADAVPGRKKTTGSVGKKAGASLAKKTVAGKTDAAGKVAVAGSVGKKAGTALGKKTGAAAAGRVTSPSSDTAEKTASTAAKTASTAAKTGPAVAKAGSAAGKAGSTTAKTTSTVAKKEPASSAVKSDASAIKAGSSAARASSTATNAGPASKAGTSVSRSSLSARPGSGPGSRSTPKS